MNDTRIRSTDTIQCREVAKRFDTRQEEVGATSYSGEGWQSGDFLADRTLGNFEFKCTVLIADDRIAFVTKFVKITVVGPDILCELKLADEACADHKSGDAALDAIVRRVFRQVRTIGRTAADYATPVYVCCRVAGIHAPCVRSERHGVALWIHFLIIEGVVPLGIGS